MAFRDSTGLGNHGGADRRRRGGARGRRSAALACLSDFERGAVSCARPVDGGQCTVIEMSSMYVGFRPPETKNVLNPDGGVKDTSERSAAVGSLPTYVRRRPWARSISSRT